MKATITMLLSGFLFITTYAQTVTLSFRGTNLFRNYHVLIDDEVYESGSAINRNGAAIQKTITLENLSPGSHSIAVYNSTNAAVNTHGKLLYSNNFQVRSDYDMTVAINGARISFREKLIENVNTDNDGDISAMASNDFAQLLQEIKSSRYQSARVAAIREAVSSSDHFTTNQVRQLLTLVTSENTRLELAKQSYVVVTDQENYARLNTLFSTQANRNNLSNYVQLQVNGTLPPVIVPVNTRGLLTVTQYNQLLLDLNNNNYQSGKFAIIRDAFNKTSNAFTTTQIRQLLGSITSEPDRLYLAKQAYITVSDPVNFATLLTLFTTQANRTDLNNYIISNGGTGGNVYVQTKVAMTDANFRQLLQKAGNHILPWDKVKDVRVAFSDSQNFFTSSQVRQLLSVVSTGNLLSVNESSRIELAKLSYARVIDPENFTQIFDLFPDQSSKDELNGYIKLQVQNN